MTGRQDKDFLKIQCMYHSEICRGDYPAQSLSHTLPFIVFIRVEGGCASK